MIFDRDFQKLLLERKLNTRLYPDPESFLIFSNLLKSFYSSWGSSLTKSIVLDVKSRFTCGNSNLHFNTVNCQNIMTRAAASSSWTSLHLKLSVKLCNENYFEHYTETFFHNMMVFYCYIKIDSNFLLA